MSVCDNIEYNYTHNITQDTFFERVYDNVFCGIEGSGDLISEVVIFLFIALLLIIIFRGIINKK